MLIIVYVLLCVTVHLVDKEDSLSKHIDAVTARGQLSELQLRLESAETQRKRARIEHERDMETVRRHRQVLLPGHVHIMLYEQFNQQLL